MVALESINVLTKRQQNYVSCFRLLESIVQRFSDSKILSNDFYGMAILAEYCDTLIDDLNTQQLNLLKEIVEKDGLCQTLIFLNSTESFIQQYTSSIENADFHFFIKKYLVSDNEILNECFLKIVEAQILKCETNCKKRMLEITKNEGNAAVIAFLYLIENRTDILIKTDVHTDLKKYLIKMEHLLSLSDDFIDLKKDLTKNKKMVKQKWSYRVFLARKIVGNAFSLFLSYPKQFITDFVKFNRLYFFTQHAKLETKYTNEKRYSFETRQIQLGQSPAI